MNHRNRLAPLKASEGGFTLIEMVVAIIILTTAVLGIAASTAKVMEAAGQISIKAEALQAVESRMSIISMDPRYGLLDSIYGGTETSLPGLAGYTRVTTVSHTLATGDPGRILDYKTITVSVSATGLVTITRTIVMGSP